MLIVCDCQDCIGLKTHFTIITISEAKQSLQLNSEGAPNKKSQKTFIALSLIAISLGIRNRFMIKEQQLINKAKRGDKRASQQLYEQYERYWFRICLRYGKNRNEAQDILQEGLIAVFRGLKTFNTTKGNFKSWSSKVVVNAALQYLKKHQKQRVFSDLTEAQTNVDFSANILDRLAAKELIALIQQLPLGYRLVFNMYVLEGYSHQEIAQQLNISVGTSKSQLSKAKRTLRERI